MKKIIASVTALLMVQVISNDGYEMTHMDYENRVIEKILGPPYNKNVIPIRRPGDPVVINFHARLIRIIRINEREQYIEVYMWLQMQWFHPLMQWNSSAYGGLTTVKVPSQDLWLPDIVMYNSVDSEDRSSPDMNSYDANVVVSNDGFLYWQKPVILRSTCSIDVSYFPFDDQECNLKFGSWTNGKRYIDMTGLVRDNEANAYLPNGQWELLNADITKNVVQYTCCPDPYVDLTMKIQVRRDTSSYVINLIVPSALLSALVLLTFVLPPESGERVSLCITVLLAVTVFQQLTAQMMPEFGLPYLAQYYFATTIITAISLIVTTLILNLYHRSTRRTPKFIRRFVIGWLGSILFCNSKMSDSDDEITGSKRHSIKHQKNETQNSENTISDLRKQETAISNGQASKDPTTQANGHTEADEKRSISSNGFNTSDDQDLRHKEWLKVARVLDRLCLILFFLVMVIAFLAVFLRAPRFLG